MKARLIKIKHSLSHLSHLILAHAASMPWPLTVLLPFLVCWFTSKPQQYTSPEPKADPKSSPDPDAKLDSELNPELNPEPRSEPRSEDVPELKPDPSGPEPLNTSSNI